MGHAQESGWDLEHVKQAMENGPDTARANLATPIPVLLVYGTAVVQEDGEVYFYPDIYGLDARLAEVLVEILVSRKCKILHFP
jgi:L,D-transpeptidase YcbB